MNFEADAFISYAHMDNVELIEGQKGWVANLHRALEVRLGQLLGKEALIWRDPKLQGNDVFAEALVLRLRHVAALISIVSPRYIKSEWTRRELAEFRKAADYQGGLSVHNKARIFKVLKTPVPLEMHPPELRSILGYEFFKIDPETGRIRELNEVFGPEAQRDFWIRLDDLAHDICCLLEIISSAEEDAASVPQVDKGNIFLAETTYDLREQREAIRRELQQHGYTVFPTMSLTPVASEVKEVVRADLARSMMSIHLIGKTYSVVPEGGTESLMEIQNELAIERGDQGGFSRLLWIPPGMQVEDERQKKVIERIRMDPRMLRGADLLETFLEDFRTVIQNRLKQAAEPAKGTEAPQSAVVGENLARVYLIYDQRDRDAAAPWADFLFAQQVEVIHPAFDGDEAELREYHDENLRTCDGALILYGSPNECWLRRKLRELQKSAGYGRVKPAPTVAITLIPPQTPDKERFRTHEALVIPQWSGFSPDPLRAFVSLLKT
jgi:hypothetical protein